MIAMITAPANVQMESAIASVTERLTFGQPLGWWNQAMLISLGLAALAAVAVVLTTTIVVKMQGQAERDAKQAVANANAVAATAQKRAAEAMLALEQYKAPRILSSGQIADIVSRLTKWSKVPRSGQPQSAAVFAVGATLESAKLADQLALVLGEGTRWQINRYPVTYELGEFRLAGVGLLISRNERALAVATDLVDVLSANGIAAFIVPQRRRGCEDIESLKNKLDDPFCSAISVMVGDKPA